MNKYYLVTCEQGHCGRNRSNEINFVFSAPNLLKAIDKAKRMPSVKHSRLPLYGHEITKEEYTKYRRLSAYKRNGSR